MLLLHFWDRANRLHVAEPLTLGRSGQNCHNPLIHCKIRLSFRFVDAPESNHPLEHRMRIPHSGKCRYARAIMVRIMYVALCT